MMGHPSILAALGAALLFGASTPFAKQLAGDIAPILLAGLLYLGSGIGLWLVRLIRDRGFAAPSLPAWEWPWLLGAIASGGVLGPVYVVILTIATPTIGIALTMIGILAGQVFKSLIIDHFGLLGTPHRKINAKRIVALVFIIAALILVAQG